MERETEENSLFPAEIRLSGHAGELTDSTQDAARME